MYYVYQYLREDRTPYYVGKGKGDRAYSDLHNVRVPKDPSKIVFVKSNMIEEDALLLEIKLIKHYGRKDLGTGILRNLTDGGDGVSGRIVHTETRKKISVAKTEWHEMNDTSGPNNPMFGRTHSEIIKQASKERAKKHGFIGNRKGKDPWNKGITTGKNENLSKSRLKTPKVMCNKCNKTMAPHCLSRWHSKCLGINP